MGDYGALAQIIASLASTGTQVYSAVNAPKGSPAAGPEKLPTLTPTDNTQQLKALLPTEKANAAASAGGGFSPEFLANLIEQQGGDPGSAQKILGDIYASTGKTQSA